MAFVLGEVAAYQMGMTVWFIIAAALFVFHRKLCPMKHKAHSFSPAVIKTAEGRVDSDFQTDAERVWNWKDPMMCRVFLLFFCFLAGWGRMTVEMRPDALERMVTQKGGSAEVAVSGTLDSISEKNGWCTMILTGVEVEDESVRKVKILTAESGVHKSLQPSRIQWLESLPPTNDVLLAQSRANLKNEYQNKWGKDSNR